MVQYRVSGGDGVSFSVTAWMVLVIAVSSLVAIFSSEEEVDDDDEEEEEAVEDDKVVDVLDKCRGRKDNRCC